MKIKKFNEATEAKPKGISAYESVWVVLKYGDTDISEIFINRQDAVLCCDITNIEFKRNFGSSLIGKQEYKVLTLDQAISAIIEASRDIDRENEFYNSKYRE